jgi:hypothetical protein
MIFRTLVLAGGLVSPIAAAPSDAGPIFPFAGSVSNCGGVPCDKPFSGAFTVDPSVSDVVPSPREGVFINAGTIDLTFDGTDYFGNATYIVGDDSSAFLGTGVVDGFGIDAALSEVGAIGAVDFFATLVASDLDLFDDDALPHRGRRVGGSVL